MDNILNKIYEEYQRVLIEASDMYLGEYCCSEEDEKERNKDDEKCLKYMKELLKTVKLSRRVDLLATMDDFIRSIGDEDLFESWIIIFPDECDKDLMKEIAEDNDIFQIHS